MGTLRRVDLGKITLSNQQAYGLQSFQPHSTLPLLPLLKTQFARLGYWAVHLIQLIQGTGKYRWQPLRLWSWMKFGG